MRFEINFLTLFAFLLILGSCKPDREMYAPEITFIEPESGLIVHLPDTLTVRIKLNDQHLMQTAVLTLVNEDKIPVIAALNFYPDSTAYLIDVSLPITDKSLASGPYNLLLTVSDGKDQKNEYLPIFIKEVPVQLQTYFCVTARFDYKSTIMRLNPDFEPDTQFVFPHGYWLSAVHSGWDEFFFVTSGSSNLIAFNSNTFETEWEMAAAPPRPLITALIPDKDLVFSTANGDAGILSYDGNISLRTIAFGNKTIQYLAADDENIYAAHVSLSGDIHELTDFSRLNGSIWEQRLISGEIRGMIPASGKLLIFLQIANNGEIMIYDANNFTLTELTFIPDQIIKSATKISDSQVFILTDQQVISYTTESNHLGIFKNEAFKLCRYDALSDEVYLVRDSTLYGFNRNTGDLQKEKTFPEEIMDFQILYNK